jgi:hypothetical protein
MTDEDLISNLALLRFQAHISHADHQTTKKAFDVTRSFLQRGYHLIKEKHKGQLYTHYRDERLKGYLMHWFQEESWYGPPIQNCVLDFDWKDPNAVLWATQKLLEVQPYLGPHCELMLNAKYASILGVSLGAGLQMDSVVLLGTPKESLHQLNLQCAPPSHLGFMNLEIHPMMNRREVEQAVKLKRQYFTSNPQFCWFGAHDVHLKQYKEELVEAIRSRRRGHKGKNQAWVIYREDTFLGVFSYNEDESHPLWGHLAGVDIMLHPRIQKRGVVKTVYRIMLESMIEHGVSIYKGGTSQPAVMNLGSLMKRPLFSWVLRKKTAFHSTHFSPYLPASLRSMEESSLQLPPLDLD